MTVARTVSKAGYAAPKLVVYGGMAALTASGSQNAKEGSGTPPRTGTAWMS